MTKSWERTFQDALRIIGRVIRQDSAEKGRMRVEEGVLRWYNLAKMNKSWVSMGVVLRVIDSVENWTQRLLIKGSKVKMVKGNPARQRKLQWFMLNRGILQVSIFPPLQVMRLERATKQMCCGCVVEWLRYMHSHFPQVGKLFDAPYKTMPWTLCESWRMNYHFFLLTSIQPVPVEIYDAVSSDR